VHALRGKEEELPMTGLPMTRDQRSVYRALRTGGNSGTSWLDALTTDRNLVIISGFCLIGLLVTLNLIFRFPSFQPSMEEIVQILG
jgi:hypothetical protein